jgi:hypothetical protein
MATDLGLGLKYIQIKIKNSSPSSGDSSGFSGTAKGATAIILPEGQ